MSEATLHDIATTLDTTDMRDARAHRALEIVRAGRDFRWAGIYDVDDDTIESIGHSGVQAPVIIEFPADRGAIGEAVRRRATVIRNAQMIVPILGAESGIPIGTLVVERDATTGFTEEDQAFVERCAIALMPLFE